MNTIEYIWMGFNGILRFNQFTLWEIPEKWRFIAGKILCKWVFDYRRVSYLWPFPHTKVRLEYGRVEQPQVQSHFSYHSYLKTPESRTWRSDSNDMHIDIHIHIHIYKYAYAHVYIYSHFHIYILQLFTYLHTCIYIYIDIYIYACLH